MPSYILRDVDNELWQKVKERAQREGHPLRWVILELLKRYVTKGVK